MCFGAAASHGLPHAQAQRQAECRAAPCRCGGGPDSTAEESGALGGWLTASWRLRGVVPPGASAEIHLGDGWVEQVGSGMHRFSWRQRVNAAPPVLAAAD